MFFQWVLTHCEISGPDENEKTQFKKILKTQIMTLNNIAWSFSDEKYTSQEEFNKEVTQCQIDIFKNDDKWKPEEICFELAEINICYEAWVKGPEDLLENETLIDDDKDAFEEEPDEDDGYYQVEINANLKADNGKNFSALEFLFKAHNTQANKDLGDHVFFEGTDEKPEIIDGKAYCYIACGS